MQPTGKRAASIDDCPNEQIILDDFRAFTADEHDTWRALVENRRSTLAGQAHPVFVKGVEALELGDTHIPDMRALNKRLRAISGWVTVPVPGLIHARLFFEQLAERKFPVGNFIRDRADLGYTPAPDIFHDAFGHMPFFVDRRYADFAQHLGAVAASVESDKVLKRFERIYWFTVEFGLVRTKDGLRIYGGGLLSSNDESARALTDVVTRLDYDIADMACRDYCNSVMQDVLYVVDDLDVFYNSLDAITRAAYE